MAKCGDCWCEHYDKNNGNCDNCMKKNIEKEKPELSVILQQRAVRQMELDKKTKTIGQTR